MALTKVGLARLVDCVIRGWELSNRETEQLLKRLWRKFRKSGLDSFKERIVLTAYILYPKENRLRDLYIHEQILLWRSKQKLMNR